MIDQADAFGVPKAIRSAPKDALEKVVESRLHKRIRAIGGHSWKFVSVSNRGVSDRIVVYKGRVVFVEVKRTGKTLSPLQKTFRQKIIDNECEYETVCGLEGVDSFVKKLRAESSMFSVFMRSLRSMVAAFKGDGCVPKDKM
ncbi:MAG: hypothetical protein DRQ56_06730 [Gammaproteobacteria bacterium]|nr:MAG: hypothetical protein DRQ56_06730 [Gammaproteobacteria bacterium]